MHERWTADHEQLSCWADEYGTQYADRRGSMVVDVIASRQRRYRTVVLDRIVPLYEEKVGDPSLAALAETAPTFLPLRRGEAETMQQVAKGLMRFGGGDGDDECVRLWAEAMEPIRFAHRLDPFVGQTPGVGPALFAYLRMRSGADAIKPDLRVRDALAGIGLRVGTSTSAMITVAEALAAELDVRRLVLDQMLWTARDRPPTDGDA